MDEDGYIKIIGRIKVHLFFLKMHSTDFNKAS